MKSLTLARIATVLVFLPYSSVCASDQALQATATLVAPAIVTTEQAVERLFQQTPGVLTISLPPVAISPAAAVGETSTSTQSVSVTGGVPGADGRSFVFTASKENSASLDRLVAQFEAAPAGQTLQATFGGDAASSTFTDGNGYKLVIVAVQRNEDGSGYISALIPFN